MSLHRRTKRLSSFPGASVLALTLLLTSAPALGDAAAGMRAFNEGDYETALATWQPLADQGDANAQFGLGQLYGNGFGVPMDDALAIKWYTLAMEQGHAEAAYRLGVMYQNGWGVEQSDAEMLRHFQLAANGGFVEAQRSLADMYANGFGVEQDSVQAYRWYLTAGKLGDVGCEISAEELAANMPAQQVAEATQLADTWMASHRSP